MTSWVSFFLQDYGQFLHLKRRDHLCIIPANANRYAINPSFWLVGATFELVLLTPPPVVPMTRTTGSVRKPTAWSNGSQSAFCFHTPHYLFLANEVFGTMRRLINLYQTWQAD